MINIVCWKWDAGLHPKKKLLFTSTHVNRLGHMLSRNLSIPYQFHCITDDPEGVEDSVNCIPLWDDYADMGGCYRRLKIFSEEMKDQIGDYIVSIDLDCVILRDISDLFDQRPDFKALKGTNPRTFYSGTLFMLRAGARKEVWDDFDPMKAKELERVRSPRTRRKTKFVGTDQAYISHVLKDEPVWEPGDEGIYLFRKFRKGARPLPSNTRVVFFNGVYDPSQRQICKEFPWIKKYWR